VSDLRCRLDDLYARYNRPELVHPDPLEFLYRYRRAADREIAGLVASSLAYGRVAQILKSVACVLERMHEPAEFLKNSSESELLNTFRDFCHRFTSGSDLAVLLAGAGRAIERYGSLEACFCSGLNPDHETVTRALSRFSKKICLEYGAGPSYLLPDPDRGSACKRAFLFLRWMVRRDSVDPGGWSCVPVSKLVVPLDTHMFRIAGMMGFTARKQADLRAALEITRHFRNVNPADPVKYDFVLTRFGIRNDMDCGDLQINLGSSGPGRRK